MPHVERLQIRTATSSESLSLLGATWVGLSILLVLLVGLITLLVSGFGWRPVSRYAIGAFYWSACLLPAGPVLFAATIAALRLADGRSSTPIIPVLVTACIASAVMILVVVRRLGRAIRGIRYANS
jgi:hypothetical protein